MSLFSSLAKKQEEDNNDLQELYEHLLKLCETFEVEQVEQLVEGARLNEGITLEAILQFRTLIDLQLTKRNRRIRFQVDTEEKLDWYFGARSALSHELQDMEGQYKKELTRLKSQIQSLEFVLKPSAEAFIRAQYLETGKKTRNLPHGTYLVRTEKPSWKLDNEETLQTWLGRCSANDKELFEIYPKSWTRNLEKLKFNAEKGVAIPGLKYDEGGDKISLRFPKENE